MKLTVVVFFVVLSLSSVAAIIVTRGECASPAGVESTCKSVAGAGTGKFTYEFCIAALSRDKSSKTAGLSGLAAIAIKQALAQAISTESKFEEVGALEDDMDIRLCFDRCLDAYADAIDGLRDALDLINNGIPKRAGKLLVHVTSANDDCEDAFEEGNVAISPMAREDRDYEKLAEVAMAIIKNIE